MKNWFRKKKPKKEEEAKTETLFLGRRHRGAGFWILWIVKYCLEMLLLLQTLMLQSGLFISAVVFVWFSNKVLNAEYF